MTAIGCSDRCRRGPDGPIPVPSARQRRSCRGIARLDWLQGVPCRHDDLVMTAAAAVTRG